MSDMWIPAHTTTPPGAGREAPERPVPRGDLAGPLSRGDQRLGQRSLGFNQSAHSSTEKSLADTLPHVAPDDLIEFGVVVDAVEVEPVGAVPTAPVPLSILLPILRPNPGAVLPVLFAPSAPV